MTAAALSLLLAVVQARTWTSADGTKTFEAELKSYDATTGAVSVTLANGKVMKFQQDKLSAEDIEYVKTNGKSDKPGAASQGIVKSGMDESKLLARADGKGADMSNPVQVFFLPEQSNMVGSRQTKRRRWLPGDRRGEWTNGPGHRIP